MAEKERKKEPAEADSVSSGPEAPETFGEYIRRAREKKGVSLEEMVESTSIRLRVLQALENNDREGLPAEVFVRGFIRIYAETLDLDPDECLTRYWQQGEKDGDRAGTAGKKAMRLKPVAKEPVFPATLLFGLGFLGLFVAFLVYLGLGGHGGDAAKEIPQPAIEQAREAETPVLEDSAGVAPEAAAPPPAVQEEPARVAPEQVASAAPPPEEKEEVAPEFNYVLKADFIEDTWLWIQIDEQDSREFTFHKGDDHTWQANNNIDIYFGNAGGAELNLNGRQLPRLGEPGHTIKVSIPKDFPR